MTPTRTDDLFSGISGAKMTLLVEGSVFLALISVVGSGDSGSPFFNGAHETGERISEE